MKKLLLLFILFPAVIHAQNFFFSGRFGMAGYQGDLKDKSLSFKGARIMGSLGARYDLSEHVTLRSYISLTSLQADDKNGSVSKQTRNLNFKTRILDWEGGLQYNILDPNSSWWIPYVYAGVGVFRFNPYTKDVNGEKVFLKPLSTEGQGFINGIKEYSRTQISIPFGVGVDRSLSEDVRVGIEFGYRKTFTDYLDDISRNYVDENALLAARGAKAVELAYRGDEVNAGAYPPGGYPRGNLKTRDGYFYVGLTLTVRHFFDSYKKTSGIPAGRKEKRAGCPAANNR